MTEASWPSDSDDGTLARQCDMEKRLTAPNAPYALKTSSQRHSCPHYAYGPSHLKDLLRMLERRGTRDFLITPGGRHSYSDVLGDVLTFTQVLKEQFRISKGDHIGLAATNSLSWVVAFFSILACQAVPVLLSSGGLEILNQQVDLSSCRLVITNLPHCPERLGAKQSPALTVHDTLLKGTDFVPSSISQLLASIEDCDPQEKALIAFTSGSTGKPKAVMLSNRGIVTGLMNMMLAASIAGASKRKDPRPRDGQPCTLVLAPLSHISGYTPLLSAIMLGSKIVFTDRKDPTQLLELSEEEAVTSIAGLTNGQTVDLLQADRAAERLRSIRSWNVNGGGAERRVINLIAEALPKAFITSSYGMTETNGGICIATGDSLLNNSLNAGRLVPTVDCRITDPAGNILDAGAPGDIWIRGEMTMLGYLTEAAADNGLQDGWFLTGDIGYVIDGRNLVVLGRREELLTFGEEVVAALGVEQLLKEGYGALDACAVKCGQRLMVAAVPAKNMPVKDTLFLADELIRRLGLIHVRPHVFLCEKMPMTSTGKVDRKRVIEMCTKENAFSA